MVRTLALELTLNFSVVQITSDIASYKVVAIMAEGIRSHRAKSFKQPLSVLRYPKFNCKYY